MARPKKEEEISNTLDELEKLFGKGTMITADKQEEQLEKVKDVTSTGSLTLDLATGIGGIPKNGLLTQIVGEWSTGKTTLSLSTIGNEHKKNPESLCAFLDLEGTLDLRYATNIGVDLKRLHLVNSKALLKNRKIEGRKQVSGEEWVDVLIKMLNSNIYEYIVLDSVAGLVPLSEIEAGMSESAQMARVGALLSKAMRNITSALRESKTGVIFLNQYRMSPGKYGDPREEVGGQALKFFTALKIELMSSLDKDANGVYGIIVRGKIGKSKVARPHLKFEYYIEFGRGIIQAKEIFDMAVNFNFIEKKGGWYYLDEETKVQGEDNVLKLLEDNPELFKHYEAKVFAKIEDDKNKSESPVEIFTDENQKDSGTDGSPAS